MPKEIYEVLTDSFDVTVISLLYSSVIQMLQHGPLLHFIIFWKGYSYFTLFFLNYIKMNFSIYSQWLLDLQMVKHINIYVCQSCSFKGIIQIYKE